MTTAYWDITARCNSRCVYCAVAADLARRGGDGPGLPTVLSALDRLRSAGVDSVVLLGGEPTLRPDLAAIVRAARRRGLRVGVATNGLALNSDLRRWLLQSDELAINISLDSHDAAENDAVRGAGYHAACTRHLRALLAERRASGAPLAITLQVTLSRANLAGLSESLPRLLDTGVDSILVDRMRALHGQPAAVKALALEPREWIRAAGRVARLAAGRGGARKVRLNFGNVRLRSCLAERCGYRLPLERRCPAGLEVVLIDFAGDLHPCRAILKRPVPQRIAGDPYYRVVPPNIRAPEAARFLESRYFTDFYNFAHGAPVYAAMALCRACPHFEVCEPCPLDIATFGEQALGECRALSAGCEV